MDKKKFIGLLDSEMALSTGCTEPAAIAFVSAVAAEQLPSRSPDRVLVRASGNMLKNAMYAGIPGSSRTGVSYAAAIGAVGGNSEEQLKIFDSVPPEAVAAAERLVEERKVDVELAEVTELLYVDVTVSAGGSTARAVISGSHTNLILVEKDGKTVFTGTAAAPSTEDDRGEEDRNWLSVRSIFDFVSALDTRNDPIGIIRQSIAVNSAISEEGLKADYGLKIGKNILERQKQGVIGEDMATYAASVTSAASDVRMAGGPFPAVSNSGSGNQGITTTMPVVATARWIKADEDKLIRAAALSNLVAIHMKTKFGRLSALCGATVAATGAACGVTYLLGGGLAEIECAIQNMIGNLAGMICDGAKTDCALKISTCTQAAMHAAFMAVQGQRVKGSDGINADDVEKAIDNFAELSAKGSAVLDSLILNMMIEKSKM